MHFFGFFTEGEQMFLYAQKRIFTDNYLILAITYNRMCMIQNCYSNNNSLATIVNMLYTNSLIQSKQQQQSSPLDTNSEGDWEIPDQSVSDANPEVCQFEELVYTDNESYCGNSVTDDYLSETDTLECDFLEETEVNISNNEPYDSEDITASEASCSTKDDSQYIPMQGLLML